MFLLSHLSLDGSTVSTRSSSHGVPLSQLLRVLFGIWNIIVSMNTDDLILAAMFPGGGYRYTPVQVQKLLFLIDRQIPRQVGGPHFNFEPYHYGPFDIDVYAQLDRLAGDGFVAINQYSSPRTFTLTAGGAVKGSAALDSLPAPTRDFIVTTSLFVQAQSFSSLVSAIYKAFPDMKQNSVFQSVSRK
jgi:uncharacterized protein